MEKANFHIEVTDNRTGEQLVCADSNCIMGAFDHDKHVAAMGFTECDGGVVFATIRSCIEILKKIDKGTGVFDAAMISVLLGERTSKKDDEEEESTDED